MGVYIKYSRHALSIMLSNMISIKSCKPFSRFACLLIIDESCSFVSNIVFLVRFVLHFLSLVSR